MLERLNGGPCGQDAKNESVEAILAAARMKSDAAAGLGGKAKKIIVTGCLAQRYSEAGPGPGPTRRGALFPPQLPPIIPVMAVALSLKPPKSSPLGTSKML